MLKSAENIKVVDISEIYKSKSKNMTPEQQIIQIDQEMFATTDLNRLSKKYESIASIDIIEDGTSDMITNILMEKERTIEELKGEIQKLNLKIVDIGVEYNEKIESLRTDHKREIYRLYKDFIKKISELKDTHMTK